MTVSAIASLMASINNFLENGPKMKLMLLTSLSLSLGLDPSSPRLRAPQETPRTRRILAGDAKFKSITLSSLVPTSIPSKRLRAPGHRLRQERLHPSAPSPTMAWPAAGGQARFRVTAPDGTVITIDLGENDENGAVFTNHYPEEGSDYLYHEEYIEKYNR